MNDDPVSTAAGVMFLLACLAGGLSLIAYAFAMLLVRHRVIERRLGSVAFPSVDALLDELGRRLPGVTIHSRGERLDQTQLSTIGGARPRPVKLSFFNRIDGLSGRQAHVRFELSVDTPAQIDVFRLGVARASPESRRSLDANPFIEGVLGQAMREFQLGMLRISDRKLVATAPLGALEPSAIPRLVTFLHDLAAEFETVALQVRVLGGERKAFKGRRGSAGAARCALCHDGITGEEADLVACHACQTVLHESCWQDLGRCPVLGCGGGEPERAGPAVRA